MSRPAYSARYTNSLSITCAALLGLAAVGCTEEKLPPPCVAGTPGCLPVDNGQGDGDSDSEAELPCDVKTVLDQRCGDCHGKDNKYPAPMKLVNYKNLHETTPSGDAKVYEQILTRITSESMPMPPLPYEPLSEKEQEILSNWINDSAPQAAEGESCSGDGDGDGDGEFPGDGDGDGDVVGDGDGDGDGNEPIAQGKTYRSVEQSGGPADCKDYYEVRAHNKQVDYDKEPFKLPKLTSNQGNKYRCFYFKPPYNAGDQALWFKPLIDQSKNLHHWLLYGSDALGLPSGSSADCSAAEPGAYLLAGWAPGAGDTTMPKDVGLQMPSGPAGGLILEVHYFSDSAEDIEDNSGVKFCTVPKGTRKHEAAVHFTGGENICLDPNAAEDVTGLCNPSDNQDIHIINFWPHMHKLGTRMQLNHLKPNGTWGGFSKTVLHDKPFNFNNQIAYPINDVILKPGEQLETICSFKNTTNALVPFGENTQREMCYGFVTAWPAGALQTDPLTYNPVDVIATGIQPARRCMNLTSIFGSCNGLADYPLPK
jgi:hypothetical protein